MIHWNISPEIIELGPVRLRWYGILFLTGFLIGYRIVQKMCQWEGKRTEVLDQLLIYLIAGTAIGARVGHCFFYEPEYYFAHPLEIFAIWKGGLASHGGGVGVFVALWIFSRRYPDFGLWWLFDRIAFPTAMTGGFIRLGNLMNSEILGKPTDGTWGFIFDRVDQVPRHPTQIYESLSYFLIAICGYLIYRRSKQNLPRGLIFGFTLFTIYTARFFLEFFKENQVAFESSMSINMGQLLSLPYVVAGLFFMWQSRRLGPVPSSVPATGAKAKRKKN